MTSPTSPAKWILLKSFPFLEEWKTMPNLVGGGCYFLAFCPSCDGKMHWFVCPKRKLSLFTAGKVEASAVNVESCIRMWQLQ